MIRITFSSEAEETKITERDINEVYDVNMNEPYKAVHQSSKVYLAKRKIDGKEVIIKKPNREDNYEFRVKHEYDVVKSLDHECIVKIIDKIYKNPSLEGSSLFDYYLVFEKVEGQTLLDYILENYSLIFPNKENDIIKYFRNILITVEYIHKNDVIHCDLKASDIMVNKGNIKVLDFGEAANSSFKKSFEKFNYWRKIYGQHYAPEIQDGKNYGPKADIYSIGWLFDHTYKEFVPQDSENYKLCKDLTEKCMKKLDIERISAIEALRHLLFKPFLPETFGFSQLKKFKSAKKNVTLEKIQNTICIFKDAIKIKIEEINPPKSPILGPQRKNPNEFKFYINDEELDIYSVLNKHIDLIKIAFDEIRELSFKKENLRECMNDQEIIVGKIEEKNISIKESSSHIDC